MGRGGGSHGGGGGGHRSHSHSSHRSHSHYHSRSRGDGGDAKNSLSSLAIISCFFFLFFICTLLSLILFIFTGARVDDVCDGIISINKNEQRICKPTKKEDVKIPSMRSLVTAYRYDDNNLPSSETRTTSYSEYETVYRRSWSYFDFSLVKGGTVTLEYKVLNNNVTNVYLMDLEQFTAFNKSGHEKGHIWGKIETKYAYREKTLDKGGVYFIVVDNPGTVAVDLSEKVNITTEAYNVSHATAKESCSGSYPCEFKKVEPTESIIVSYSGSSSYVNVRVYHGKGSFDKTATAPLIFMGFFALLFCVLGLVCLLKALKKCGNKAKKAVEKAAEKAADGTVKVDQSGVTPGSVPITPVGPTPGAAAPAPYPAYDPTMSGAAPAPPYPSPGTDNPYPDGMPPPDPMNPYGLPAYGADPSAVPYPGQPGYGVPSTTV